MEQFDTFSVIIVEDEHPARELLVDYILTRPELRLAVIARTGDDALRDLSSRQFDLVFMDIHLPKISGIEVLERLDAIPYLIFTTAHDVYASRAFEFGAVDYLLKPYTLERFNRAIDKFITMRRIGTRGSGPMTDAGLTIKEQGRHYILPYQDIVYCSSHGKNTVIHTRGKDFTAPVMLGEIENRLPDNIFMRIHKQFLLNVRYLSSLEYFIGGQYIAFLNNSDENTLPIGRKYAALVKERLRLD